MKYTLSSIVVLILLSLNLSFAKTGNAVFEKIFNDWTNAFNQKILQKSCDLFSKHVEADYRGIGKKNYESICEGFKKIFADNSKRYRYRFKIHQVWQSENLAAVRITWYLDIYKNNNLISRTQDEGLDILVRNKQGQWQIINYLAYAV